MFRSPRTLPLTLGDITEPNRRTHTMIDTYLSRKCQFDYASATAFMHDAPHSHHSNANERTAFRFGGFNCRFISVNILLRLWPEIKMVRTMEERDSWRGALDHPMRFATHFARLAKNCQWIKSPVSQPLSDGRCRMFSKTISLQSKFVACEQQTHTHIASSLAHWSRRRLARNCRGVRRQNELWDDFGWWMMSPRLKMNAKADRSRTEAFIYIQPKAWWLRNASNDIVSRRNIVTNTYTHTHIVARAVVSK